MTKIKKIISIALVILVLFASSPVVNLSGTDWLTVEASAAYEQDGFTYEFIDGGVEISRCSVEEGEDIVIPYELGGTKVISLGYGAFSWCNVKNIIIHENITYISEGVCYDYSYVEKFIVSEDNEYYSSDEYGVLYNKNKTELLRYPTASITTTFSIPNTVTTIYDSAFSRCETIENVVIPDSVTILGSLAFHQSPKLKSVVMGGGIKEINHASFSECFALTDVNIGSSVKKIDLNAFDYCTSLESIIIPNTVETIGEGAFYRCYALKNVIIENGVMSIGEGAFRSCESLEKIEIPASVSNIGLFAFRGCFSLSDITVDENNGFYSSDKNGVLYNKDKTELIQYLIGNTAVSFTVPDSVKYIETGAFYLCENLTEVTIGKGVERIGEGAFNACRNLKEITIPEGVKAIESVAFADCGNLSLIVIPASVNEVGYRAFVNWENQMPVHYCGTSEQWEKVLTDEYDDLLDIIHVGTDADKDALCDICGYDMGESEIPDEPEKPDLPDEPDDPSEKCSCNCHKGGIMGFIWKILNIFFKIFRVKPVCECGIAHY